MKRNKKSLFGLAGILLFSTAAALAGVGLYNTGKFAGMAASPARDIPNATQRRPNDPPESDSLTARQRFVATAAATNSPSPNRKPATATSYLQSASDPEKRVVYEEDQSGNSSHEDKLTVYRSLQETCQRWTTWYNKDRTANSAVQMNVACREAADYGRTQLNLDTKPKQVNLRSVKEKPASSSGGAVLIGTATSQNESPRCQDLRRQLDNIQSRLRSGYKVKEGERLKKRRREIREEIQQRC